jgi:hypothetical protein
MEIEYMIAVAECLFFDSLVVVITRDAILVFKVL